MSDQNKNTKILLVAMVFALIVGVWGYRRYQDAQEASSPDLYPYEQPEKLDVSPVQVSSIDLDELKAKGMPILINFTGDG